MVIYTKVKLTCFYNVYSSCKVGISNITIRKSNPTSNI
nr:MAG TPA: hypothetical protein [Caudoviricetes sp.]DAN63487.1 MAG TPA: hypothetical protein [Caudoviricetes sp.]